MSSVYSIYYGRRRDVVFTDRNHKDRGLSVYPSISDPFMIKYTKAKKLPEKSLRHNRNGRPWCSLSQLEFANTLKHT